MSSTTQFVPSLLTLFTVELHNDEKYVSMNMNWIQNILSNTYQSIINILTIVLVHIRSTIVLMQLQLINYYNSQELCSLVTQTK